jgi:tripartite-type tricarboxylate transporter receptor subunit TctC
MAWAKANPKDANYGSPAAGAMPHFVGVMLARAAGVPMNHVPFKGGAPLVSDLLGGQIQSGVNPLSEPLPHHQAGKLRILAVSGAQRSKTIPEVPTLAEAGYKDVVAEEYFGVFVPSKTPAAAVAKLNAAVRNALKAAPVIEGLNKLAWDIKGESPEDFARIVGTELKRWGPVVQASGFTAEE